MSEEAAWHTYNLDLQKTWPKSQARCGLCFVLLAFMSTVCLRHTLAALEALAARHRQRDGQANGL